MHLPVMHIHLISVEMFTCLIESYFTRLMLLGQWHSQGWARPSQSWLCPTNDIAKDQDTLIEQSIIVLKSSVGLVVPCQIYPLWLQQCSRWYVIYDMNLSEMLS